MKILPPSDIQQLDQYTIENEPITSHQLMERASQTFTNWLAKKFGPQLKDANVAIFCGVGNNGGDGLAIARLLPKRTCKIGVFLCKFSEKRSEDFATNLALLKEYHPVTITEVQPADFQLNLSKNDFIIDAIFGSGLNRPIENEWATLIEELNKSAATRISVDIPSGLFADKKREGATIRADHVFSFELPKLAFLFPENAEYVGDWEVGSIGLNNEFLNKVTTRNFYLTANDISLKNRKKYSHKGMFGHALIVAGSYGKMGAATLSAKAALKTGAGLVTLHSPKCGYEILQIALPEAMVQVDDHQFCWSTIGDMSSYKSIGIGPGIGTSTQTQNAFLTLLKKANQPLVLDADALNILAKNPGWFKHLPKNSILTPHPKEFERLFGKTSDNFARNQLQREKAQTHQIFIILKGAHTCIATPNGNCYFNSTGNSGMATGGSGDVLTGILTGFLAQPYIPLEACLLGVYLHGLAGDLAAAAMGQEAVLASDIVGYLGLGFERIRKDR